MNLSDYLGIILLVLSIATFVIFVQSLFEGDFKKMSTALFLTVVFILLLIWTNPWIAPRSHKKTFILPLRLI